VETAMTTKLEWIEACGLVLGDPVKLNDFNE
jgi:hypothetical protein